MGQHLYDQVLVLLLVLGNDLLNNVLFIRTLLVLALSTRTSAKCACRALAVTFAFPEDNYDTSSLVIGGSDSPVSAEFAC
jgi:hypothetical protein